jgi:hypothetical protein
MAPIAHDENDYAQTKTEGYGRHGPGDEIESFGGRGGEDCFAILLHEILEDEIVGFAARDIGIELLLHSAAQGAIQMIAFGEQLAAAAHADEFAAEGVGTVILRVQARGGENPKQGEKK